MKDKYINDIEPMIQNWLKSGNENTTMIAYEIAEYVRKQIELCSIPHVVKLNCFCPRTKYDNCDRDGPCLECNGCRYFRQVCL